MLLRTLWVKRNVELAHHRNHQKSNPVLIAGLLFFKFFIVEYGKCNIVGAKDEQYPQPSNRNCERASNIQLRKRHSRRTKNPKAVLQFFVMKLLRVLENYKKFTVLLTDKCKSLFLPIRSQTT